jgi:pyruvate/2-oxoglutarate dehydrogenase complex dihydrolipoamide dehydrogenase (E3) component
MAFIGQLQRVHEIAARAATTPALPIRPRHPEDGLDASLLARLRPSAWTNPQPHGRYDLLVVGGGAAGVAAAEHAASSGVRVALATDEPLGLDVLADGLPRAVLLRSAAQVCQIRRAAATSWPDARLGRLDFASLAEQLSAARQEAADRYAAQTLAERGIAVHLGPLVFSGPNCLKVAGQPLGFSRAVLAPVPRTAVPEIEGLEDLGFHTPETLGMLTQLPRRWAIVGSSTVACELAQAFRRLGSAVDLIIPESRLLAEHEAVIGELMARQFAADGIEVHCGWTCLRSQRTGAAKSLVIGRGGQLKKLLADEILIAGERRCELGWLRLGAAGIAVDEAGIQADECLRTSNPRVFAIGPGNVSDALAGEAVEGLARLAVGNALSWRGRTTHDLLLAPRWLRTDPLVCWLGHGTTRSVTSWGDRREGSQADDITSQAFPLPPEAAAGVGLTMFNGGTVLDGGSSLGGTAMGGAPSGWLVLRVAEHHRRVVGATVLGPAARDLVAPLTAMLAGRSHASGILKALWPRGNSAAPSEPAWLGRLVEEALA